MSHRASVRTLWDTLVGLEQRLRASWQGTAAPGHVISVTKVASHIAILRIGKPPGFYFEPGQYVKLGIPDGKRNRYTMASAPTDPHLEFCVEAVPGGRVAPQLIALKPGARVKLKHKIRGEFLLVPKAETHVMLATGTGISPFRSMLRDAVGRRKLHSRFVILHGASFADELVYRDELSELARVHPEHVRYLPSVSRPSDPRNAGFQGLTGRVSELAPALVSQLQADRAGRGRLQVYACGHPDMVAGAHDLLEPLGVRVQSEVFD